MIQEFLSKRENVAKLALLAFSAILLFFMHAGGFIKYNFYMDLSMLVLFFVHTFYMLPLLFKKKKYWIYVLIVLLVVIDYSLHDIHSSVYSGLMKNGDLSPLEFWPYFNEHFVTNCISIFATFLPFWIVSFLIYIVSLSSNERKVLWAEKRTRAIFSNVLLAGIGFLIFANFYNRKDFWVFEIIGQPILLFSLFIIHTRLLLPMLIEQKKRIHYFLWVIAGFLFFVLSKSWFFAVQSSKIVRYTDGLSPEPMDILIENQFIQNGVAYCLVYLIPFWIVSFIVYTLSRSTVELKKYFPKLNLEVLANGIIVFLIFLLIQVSHIGQSMFLLVIFWLALFYVHTFFILPFYFKKGSVTKYIVIMFICLVFYQLYFNLVARPPELRYLFWGDFPIQTLVFAIITFLSFVYSYSRNQLQYKDLLFNRKSSELDLLKSQVNPHFLFNSLNTLYSTALEENAPSTAASTAKLANLIRYMQEDMKKDFIPLLNEVQYIKDYVEFQKIRCAIEPEVEINTGGIEEKLISPGLLIPFVENAFKYGVHPAKQSTIKIEVKGSLDAIDFTCINDVYPETQSHHQEQGFGIGITNTKDRLNLVYPNHHDLIITEAEDQYKVELTIKPNE